MHAAGVFCARGRRDRNRLTCATIRLRHRGAGIYVNRADVRDGGLVRLGHSITPRLDRLG